MLCTLNATIQQGEKEMRGGGGSSATLFLPPPPPPPPLKQPCGYQRLIGLHMNANFTKPVHALLTGHGRSHRIAHPLLKSWLYRHTMQFCLGAIVGTERFRFFHAFVCIQLRTTYVTI